MDIPRVDILPSSRAKVSILSVSFCYKSQEIIRIQLARQSPLLWTTDFKMQFVVACVQ